MRFTSYCLAAATALSIAGVAGAQTVVFQDTFDRANSRDIDASLDGITDNTGTLSAGNVYFQPQLDPNNATGQDSDPANGGGASIAANQLILAEGAGTSNAYVNYNFVDSNSFSVSVDINGFSGRGNGQGGAIALGMSQALADSAGDAFSGEPKFTDGFTGASNGPGAAVADFWMAFRGDGSLAFGSSGNNNFYVINDVASADAAHTVSASFVATDFNAGSTVAFQMFVDGMALDSSMVDFTGANADPQLLAGTFTWTNTDANYIGLDARDGQGVFFDNFSVTTPVPEPATLGLAGLAGVALLRRRK